MPNQRPRLRDHLRPDLHVLFVGINPGLRSAALGHHFAGHSNRFWKVLFESGLVDRQLTYEEDHLLLERGLGLTNIVDRPTRSADELGPEDFARGRKNLKRKIEKLEPQVVAFVGVVVFRQYFQAKAKVECGPQSLAMKEAAIRLPADDRAKGGCNQPAVMAIGRSRV